MAEVFSPLTLSSLTNQTSAINTINSNFTTISTLFLDVLSRSGVTPNQMTANLDMNSNRILNLLTPQTASEPLRLADINMISIAPGTLVLPGSTTTNSIVTWTTTTPTQLSSTGVTIDSSNNVVIPGTLTIAGAGKVRKVLTGNVTYYVRTDGNDSNSGLVNNAGGAFLTLQACLNAINLLDLNGHAATIQLGSPSLPASFAGFSISGPIFETGSVIIVGDLATPSNYILTSTVDIENFAQISMGGMTFSSTGSNALQCVRGGMFTAAGAINFGTTTFTQVYSTRGSDILISYNVSLVGNAVNFCQASHGGRIRFDSAVVIGCASNLTYDVPTGILYVDNGEIITTGGCTFTANGHTITGRQYNIINNGLIQIEGIFPPAAGTVFGTTAPTGTWLLGTFDPSKDTTLAANLAVTGSTTLAAGTTTLAPLTFVSGTNLTTPVAGVLEYDGSSFYASPVASGRALIPAAYSRVLAAAATGTNGTSAQQWFPTSGKVTVTAGTTYYFEGALLMTTGATSHTLALSFGGTATLTNIGYMVIDANTAAAVNTVTSNVASIVTVNTASSTVVSVATTATAHSTFIRGAVTINAGGTFIPQFTFSADPTGTISILPGTNFMMWPTGNTVVGNWS